MRIFEEEQRFNQTWIIVLMVISTIMPLAILLHTHINNPESFSGLEFAIAIMIIILASSMIFFLKMNTRIDDKGIHYKFFPFHYKSYEFFLVLVLIIRGNVAYPPVVGVIGPEPKATPSPLEVIKGLI